MDTTYPQSPPRYVVHHFQYGTDSGTSTVTEKLLQEGADLLKEVRNEESWHTVKVKLGNIFGKLIVPSRLVTLSASPPDIPSPRSLPILDSIKDWNEPPTAQELYALDSLEEFESTDLSSLFCSTIGDRDESPFQGMKPTIPCDCLEPLLDQGESSMKFLRLDTGPLHRVIPQPHIIVSKSYRPPVFDAIETYDRATPIYLPPHTASSFLSSPNDNTFGRRAWIIPARGTLPPNWNEAGASSAVVLDDTKHAESSSHSLLDQTTTGQTIKWSHYALTEFWKFLNTLRDLNNLGSLGISFHPACPRRGEKKEEREKVSWEASEMLPGLHTSDICSSRPANTSSRMGQTSSGSNTSSLRDCDYFKVYHDSNVSMHLRRALDLFTFRLDSNDKDSPEQSGQSEMTSTNHLERSNSLGSIGEGGQNTKRKKPKYCLLRGARLVLIDERSRGILIA
ncbi:hypothetical protein FB446DRAFT_848783 [Lentinula raphanica]|nr:hypothetical protein FB446DRAFT_848783 [Lentinula raphanica]